MDPMIQPNNGAVPPPSNDHPLDNSLTPEPPVSTPPVETPPAPAPTPVMPPEHTDSKAGDLYPPASTPADVPPSEPAGEQHHNHDAPELPKHSGTPVVAVVIAIVIALALAGLTVFAYLKTRNTSPDTNTTTTQPSTTASKATTKDVDNTSKDMDTALSSVDDTKDFAATDISDTALGL